MTDRTTLAVLGAPIAHSLSPRLHAAAYRAIGLPWTYSAIEVTEDRLAVFVDSLDDGWRGLSLTMPLKQDVLPLLSRTDDLVDLTGSANTVLLEDGGRSGFNTDVSGIVDALAGVTVRTAHIIGAGATAASSVVAAARLGAARVRVTARSPERAERLRATAARVGIELEIASLTGAGMPGSAASVPDLVISTLPGGAVVDADAVDADGAIAGGATLLEVAYDPWPGILATRWLAHGGRVVPGIEMLVHQALAQVRVFVAGDPSVPLDDEAAVLAAMRAAVDLR